ncbi:outer membrane protein [Helicobacter cetorum]|uniref:Outer membrane protein HorA n=1 Tax=Helicobacter cetorum (strain ATCC BAA-540 / CCUG 52418 / MIT 99-5656) TaxID=1163745 RepID=I0EQI0_HELCM|nr:outer membrane protein [Helicobacter cetorum]AFI05199.1 outer membrane protein HorA [Helicobacter cetorum MIT 99-5656]
MKQISLKLVSLALSGALLSVLNAQAQQESESKGNEVKQAKQESTPTAPKPQPTLKDLWQNFQTASEGLQEFNRQMYGTGNSPETASNGSVYYNYNSAINSLTELANTLYGARTTKDGKTTISPAVSSQQGTPGYDATQGYKQGTNSLSSQYDALMGKLYSADGRTYTPSSDGNVTPVQGSLAQRYNEAHQKYETAQKLYDDIYTLLYGDNGGNPVTDSNKAAIDSLKSLTSTGASSATPLGISIVLDSAKALQSALSTAMANNIVKTSVTSINTAVSSVVGNIVTTLQSLIQTKDGSTSWATGKESAAKTTLTGLANQINTLSTQATGAITTNLTSTRKALVQGSGKPKKGQTPGTLEKPAPDSLMGQYQAAMRQLYGNTTVNSDGQVVPAKDSVAGLFDAAISAYEKAADALLGVTATIPEAEGKAATTQEVHAIVTDNTGAIKQGTKPEHSTTTKDLQTTYQTLQQDLNGNPATKLTGAIAKVQAASQNLAQAIEKEASSLNINSMSATASGMSNMKTQTLTLSSAISTLNTLGAYGNLSSLSSTLSTLATTQGALSTLLNSASATVGQLNTSSSAVIDTINKALSEVSAALVNLTPVATPEAAKKPEAKVESEKKLVIVTQKLAATNTSPTQALLATIQGTLQKQKQALLSVNKNIKTAINQAKQTHKPSVTNTNNYGQMYGVNVMAGYKQFFGKAKRWGVRAYGYYSYNHANLSFVGSKLGILSGASQVNDHTYGVGFDALYNFYESKEGYNTAGMFFGFGVGGETWMVQGESYYKAQMQTCNSSTNCSASMNTTYFQMPVQVGFRTNFAKHSGIELGFKLPLFVNQFYKERSENAAIDVFYKRNFSMYFNYMINF